MCNYIRTKIETLSSSKQWCWSSLLAEMLMRFFFQVLSAKTINLEILLGRNYYGIIFCIILNVFKRKLMYIFSTLLYIFKTYLYIFSKLMYIFSTFWNEKKYNAEQYIYFLNHFRQSSTFCIQIFSYLQLYLYLHS